MGTREVVQRHIDAFLEGDVEKCLADYTEESVILRTDAVVRGLSTLEGLFREAFAPGAIFAAGNGCWVVDSLICEGEYAWMTWHHEWAGFIIPFGADAFVVRDDKIAMQTGAWFEIRA